MGNCCRSCFGRVDKRNYLRTRYNVERELSVEFDNLLEDEGSQPLDAAAQVTDTTWLTQPFTVTAYVNWERKLVTERRFNDLVQYQLQVDAEIHAQLIEQEEKLRRDEEVFFEAKRQAARVASKLRSDELTRRRNVEASKKWTATDEWEIANGEEDFEQFLESVRLRSLNARMRVVPSEVVQVVTPCSESGSTKDDSAVGGL